MNSKTFCILPWAHTRITTDGTVTPCCKINSDFSNQNINTLENFDDWWNNDRMRDLRKDLGSGIKNQNCAVCWADEAAGKSSLRQEYNKRLGKHTNLKKITKSTTYINEQSPIALELDMGNICNFKCMMCDSKLSSKIRSERIQHHSKFSNLKFLPPVAKYDFDWPNQDIFQTWFKKVMPGIKILQLKGGEPLLINNALTTIKSIKEKKNTLLYITTNGSVELDDEFVDSLKEFQSCAVHVSVDGIEQHGEYVRYGSHWPTTHQTITKLSKLSNCTFRINTVFQFYSALTFAPIVEYALKNNLDVELLLCHFPKFLSINSMLPRHHAELTQFVDNKVQLHPHVTWLREAEGFLKTYKFDSILHQQCFEYTQTLNSIRHNKLDAVQELFHNV